MEISDGFLVINKEKGCTSHDCVKQIRRLLNTKKVGHTGTLDPEVTGTLPIAVGSATRFIQYLPQGKTYIGQIKLGIRTNTDDIHGEVINQKSWPKISDEKLKNLKGMNNSILAKLAKSNILNVNDFADLATFELIDKEEGILRELDLDEEIANNMIMEARSFWSEEQNKD